MNVKKWIDKNAKDLSGKVVAITGATGDLASNLCRYLLRFNAQIIMLDRNSKKSLALKDKLLAEFPDAKIENIKLDLADMQNVKQVCNRLESVKIDFLILNAGVYNVPCVATESGYNNIFQINFVSNYYLVKKLLPSVRNSNGKIVALSSIAHKSVKLDENDVDFSRNKRAMKIYGNSKRFLTYALFELLKDETAVSFAVAHPGVVATNMTTHYRKSVNWLVKAGMKIIFPPAEKAALNFVYAVYENCGYNEWIGPNRFGIWGKPKKRKLKSCNQTERRRIFTLAEEIFAHCEKCNADCKKEI